VNDLMPLSYEKLEWWVGTPATAPRNWSSGTTRHGSVKYNEVIS